MGLYKRKDSSMWWMSFTYNRKQYHRSTGTSSYKLAEKIYAKVITQITEGKWFDLDESKQHTFDDLMEKFLKEHAPRKKASTHTRYISAIRHLKKALGGMLLADITPKVISNYMQQRLDQGVAPATVNREFRTLSIAFNLAWRQWEWVRENPCAKVQALPENNTRTRYLSSEEEERLLSASQGYLNGQLPDIITLALHTGMRQSEILSLMWRHIDLFRKTITVEKTKNNEPRTIPMNNTVYFLLLRKARSKVVTMTEYVFHTESGKSILRRNLMREFYKALAKAGIQGFTFHDLRHTFATRLVQCGVDLYSVAKLLGHKDISSTQRYAHHSTESLRQFITLLDTRKNTSENTSEGLKQS
ncbi:tyrosine-type recombinase/integrase [Thermodesulfovibrio sp. 3462-1]|uniref:Tyrosine-type recombinase/integrase n=1 Tax=Thermodesulfovibrio obliviosus TaxID=3118332 RepID=A0AAU8GZX7_9BACT